ncbi:MAG TPA: N-acetylmuramoyl-L-alanine amidase, partial [Bacilli bacterium]|nr:N-acetylmuramoyl-L-alanine amidase [Bacilli bacterium]
SIPTPIMTGGTFKGWYTNANFSGSPVTSIAPGTTGNITLYAKWEVSGPPVGSVYLRLSFSGSGTLEVGQSMKINYSAILTGNYQADAVVWSSSNTSVAKVDQNGNVTAVGVGTAIIYARTVASGAESQVGVTVYNSSTDPLLKYLMTQNTGVLFTRVIKYYGYQGNYDNRISNTANKYLPETLSIDKSLWLSTSRANHPNVVKSSTQYIVVHDTGSSAASSTARANGGWCINPSNTGSSWHYTVGNDGIFQHIDEKYAAWHAGDGGNFTFSKKDTGVKETNIDTKKPTTTRSNNIVYINGQKSNITATSPINDHGFLYSIGSNGNYYLGNTWVNNGVLLNKGGNHYGIGIEMAVNTGSNVYYTWQRTAKLVADIMVRQGLRLPQVGFHRNFSIKMCPQTLIRAGLQDEFFRLVAAEYYIRKNYSNATITFTSSNTSILNNKGQIVNYPQKQTNVAYTITVRYGGKTYSATLYALVPGTRDF